MSVFLALLKIYNRIIFITLEISSLNPN